MVDIWNEEQDDFDDSLSTILGFTTEDEWKFIYWYVTHQYYGQGSIVEFGPFLGKLTSAILKGLQDSNKLFANRLHVYDRFVWTQGMCDEFQREFTESIQPNTSFRSDFENNIAPFINFVDIHECDLNNSLGMGYYPIELLVVDAMKSFLSCKHIAEFCFPCLIPNLSIVVQQDYNDWYASWIHILMYRMKDYFEPTFVVRNSSSVVFKCVKKIEAIEIQEFCDWTSINTGEISNAFRYSQAILDSVGFNTIEIKRAEFMTYIHLAHEVLGSYNDQDYVNLVANLQDLVRMQV